MDNLLNLVVEYPETRIHISVSKTERYVQLKINPLRVQVDLPSPVTLIMFAIVLITVLAALFGSALGNDSNYLFNSERFKK